MVMKEMTPIFFVFLSVLLFSQETKKEELQHGKFEPNWQLLKQYEIPEWFRDAKFGIWAH